MPRSALPGLADRIDKYADLPMDLADASLIWLAESMGLLELLKIDRRDFGSYRSARGRNLRNVLFESPHRLQGVAAQSGADGQGVPIARSLARSAPHNLLPVAPILQSLLDRHDLRRGALHLMDQSAQLIKCRNF